MGTRISFERPDGKAAEGYLANTGHANAPGVVVIQEWWGLNDHMRDIADRLAGEGFVALAPDRYYGETATEPDEARKLAMALEYPDALRVIQTAVDQTSLKDRVKVASDSTGVINFSSMRSGRLSDITVTGTAAAALNVPGTAATATNSAFSTSDPTS